MAARGIRGQETVNVHKSRGLGRREIILSVVHIRVKLWSRRKRRQDLPNGWVKPACNKNNRSALRPIEQLAWQRAGTSTGVPRNGLAVRRECPAKTE